MIIARQVTEWSLKGYSIDSQLHHSNAIKQVGIDTVKVAHCILHTEHSKNIYF